MMLLVTTLFAAHAAAPPPIVNGEVTSDYLPVGAIVATRGSAVQPFCSGTLIAPQWVLTAAHCVVIFDDWRSYDSDVEFWIGDDVFDGGTIIERADVDDEFYDDDYNPQWLSNDIGLVRLSTPLSTTPYVLLDETPDGTWRDDLLQAVGYGITAGSGGGEGVKRTAALPVIDVDIAHIITRDDDGRNVCSGDSGGAALRLMDDGDLQVAGVTSFVYSEDLSQDPCDTGGAGFARLDISMRWIEETMAVYDDAPVEDPDTGFEEEADPIENTSNSGYFTEPEGRACASVGQGGGGGLLAFLTLPLLSLFRRRAVRG